MKFRHTPSRDEQQAFLDYGDRVVDGDTTPPTSDLESTFLRVQRAMRSSAAASDTMPDHLRMHAWEDIMRNTAIIPTGRAAGQPGNHKQPRSFLPVPLPRMAWSGAANIALALLVVIAGFGAWRASDGGFGGGGNSPAPSEGRYAQMPMTPVPMATAETDETGTGCTFGQSVPLYQGVDTPPADGTAVYLTTSGDLVLHCDGEPEDTPLASEVQLAIPYGVPNVVEVVTGSDGDWATFYLNVVTGEQMEVDKTGFTSYLGHANQSQRFLVAPAPDDPFSWGVYDLETMTPASLNEITGGTFPTNGHLSVSIPDGGTSMAFAMGAYESEGSAHIAGDKSGAGNDIAIVHEDLATVTWMTIPGDFPPVSNISISEDGATLAIISNPFNSMDEGAANSTMIGLIDVATNQELARTEPFTAPHGPFFTWIEDGDAIAYTSENTVYRLATETGATATTLYESDSTVYLFEQIPTPNIVHVHEEGATEDEVDTLIVIDTISGEVTPLEGQAWSPGSSPVMPWRTSLAPIVMVMDEEDRTGSWNIVHPETGESIMTAESALATSPVEDEEGVIWLQQIRIVATDEPISAVRISDGRIVVFDLSTDESEITEVMLPENIEADGYKTRTVSLAPDGSALIVEAKLDDASRFWSLDLTTEDAEWMQLPEGITVDYLYAAQ